MTERRQKTWAAVGKTATLLLGIPGAIAACIWVTQAISEPREDLQATVRYYPQFWPPSAMKQGSAFRDAVRLDSIQEAITSTLSTTGDEYLAPTLAWKIGDSLRRVTSDANDFLNFESVWHVRISNVGNLLAKDIALTLPYAREAVLLRDRDATQLELKSGSMELGTLRPYEKVSVVAWAFPRLRGVSPEDVALSHSRGVGRITIVPTMPTSDFRLAILVRIATLFGILLAVILSLSVLFFRAFPSGLEIIIDPRSKD